MGKMVPFLYKTRQCFIWSLIHLPRVRARARASFGPHAPEFPLSLSLSSAYKVGETIFGRESHLATRRGQQNGWKFFVLLTFEEELSYHGSLLVRLRIWQMKTTRKYQYKRKSRGNPRGEGATPYNGLYGEAMPERGTFFKPQVYERVGILYSLNYMKGWENLSVRSVKGPKRANRWILWLYKVEKTFFFAIDSYLKDRAFTAVKRGAKF